MLTVSRDALLPVLQKITAIIQTQQTITVLSYVKFNIDKNILKLTATDLEIELVGTIQLDTPAKQPLQVMLPARKLLDICKSLPEGSQLNFILKDDKVKLVADRARFTLITLPAESFTEFGEVEAEWQVKVNQKSLLRLFKSTCFAMGSQDVRYYLNGLLLELHSSSLRAVATDGHRLALNGIAAKINTDYKAQIIVPNKSVSELIRLLENQESEVTLSLSAAKLGFSSDNLSFKTKLVDARFPNYECAMPIGLDKKIVLRRKDFAQALSRVAILSNEKIKGVRMEIEPGVMKISATNKDNEVAAEDFIIDSAEFSLDIGFNVSYLLDAVNNCESDNIELHFKDTNTSILIRENGIDSQASFVLMPLCLYQNDTTEYTTS
jgi:DNA polymerase III subunit beta